MDSFARIVSLSKQLDYIADTLNPDRLSDPESCDQLREILSDISKRMFDVVLLDAKATAIAER